MSSELFRGIEQGLLDVFVTDKVFGSTGDDDRGLSNRGVQQILEMVQSFLIGDPQDKFIKTVEDQHNPTIAKHVFEFIRIIGLPVGRKICGDEL